LFTTSRIVAIAIGLFVVFMGYLIKYKKKLFFIAGYNRWTSETVNDEQKEKLAKLIGNICILIGLATILMTFLDYYFASVIFEWIFAAVVIGASIYALVKAWNI